MYALLAFGLVLSVGSSRGAEKVREAIRSQSGVSLDFLETLVKQQMTLTKNLLASLKVEKNALTVAKRENTTLSSKVNRLSKAVGFTARFPYDNGVGMAIGSRAILRFNHVQFNAGNGYDPKTGIFTAPVAGTYSFFLNLMAHTEGSVNVLKNGYVLDHVWANGGNNQGASQVLVHLAEDDKVWVKQVDIRSLRGGPYTIFTGFLLQAD